MEKLSKASEDILEIRQVVPGSLPYGVGRSRHYRSQFKSLVTALRVSSEARFRLKPGSKAGVDCLRFPIYEQKRSSEL
jgi:hypothetical protein